MAAQSYAMRRIEPQAAAGTLVAVLGAYATALLLAHATHQHAQLMVLAVVLTLTLERTQRTADIRTASSPWSPFRSSPSRPARSAGC